MLPDGGIEFGVGSARHRGTGEVIRLTSDWTDSGQMTYRHEGPKGDVYAADIRASSLGEAIRAALYYMA